VCVGGLGCAQRGGGRWGEGVGGAGGGGGAGEEEGVIEGEGVRTREWWNGGGGVWGGG